MQDLTPLMPSIFSALDAVKPGLIRRVGSRPNSTEALFLAHRRTLSASDRNVVSKRRDVWRDEPAATCERASDEHGRFGISGAINRLNIGDKIRLVPGDCDPTVNLSTTGTSGIRVEQLWPITARGAVY